MKSLINAYLCQVNRFSHTQKYLLPIGVREATAADTPKSTVRSKRKSTKKVTKAPKVKSSSSSSGNSPNAAAEKSVRRRRR